MTRAKIELMLRLLTQKPWENKNPALDKMKADLEAKLKGMP